MGRQVHRAGSEGYGVAVRFIETSLKGAYLVEIEPVQDERGFFARCWCEREFARRGLVSNFVQCNISFNRSKGTVRGMHFQAAPHEESKLVRCTAGAIQDVIVDLRPNSPTFRQWLGAELSAGNRKMLFVPKGFAHGFQTLTDDTEVEYQMSEFHVIESARGYRWDDPAFRISWPLAVSAISDGDRNFPGFVE